MAEKRLTHTITVDLAKETWSSRPVLVQNTDNTFFINVLHNEEPVDLSDVRDVVLTTVAHRKNDGDSVYSLGVKVGGKSQVKVDLGRAAVSTPGIVDAQLKLLGVDGGVISSTTFEYEVQLDAGIKFAPSATDKTIIESVLGEGPGVIADATQTIADMESTQATLTGAVGGAISSLNEDKAQAISEMETATSTAISEITEVREAMRTNWLDAVDTIAQRDSLYPNPEQGDTVRVIDLATIYRFEDGEWIVTDEYQPTAIDEINSRMDNIDGGYFLDEDSAVPMIDGGVF